MQNYSKDSLRKLYEKQKQQKAKKRGSVFISVLIVAVFILSFVFYIKTSNPHILSKIVDCFEKVKQPVHIETAAKVTIPSFCYISQNYYKAEKEYACPLENAVVTSAFGSRTDPVTGNKNAYHHGIDMAAAKGSDIRSLCEGTVEYVKKDDIYGNCILIDHGEFSSFYAHLSSINIEKGRKVKAGDKIGVIGSSGKSTGVHLHFEIIKEGERIDPSPYLYEKI